MTFLKVNFDGSMVTSSDGVGFVIREPDSWLIATGGTHLFEPTVLRAELRNTWVGIACARLASRVDAFVIKGNSATMAKWMQNLPTKGTTHPLLANIVKLLRDTISLDIGHAYKEANSAADRVATFVVKHSSDMFWVDLGMPQFRFMIFYFLILWDIFTPDLFEYLVLSKKSKILIVQTIN